MQCGSACTFTWQRNDPGMIFILTTWWCSSLTVMAPLWGQVVRIHVLGTLIPKGQTGTKVEADLREKVREKWDKNSESGRLFGQEKTIKHCVEASHRTCGRNQTKTQVVSIVTDELSRLFMAWANSRVLYLADILVTQSGKWWWALTCCRVHSHATVSLSCCRAHSHADELWEDKAPFAHLWQHCLLLTSLLTGYRFRLVVWCPPCHCLTLGGCQPSCFHSSTSMWPNYQFHYHW